MKVGTLVGLILIVLGLVGVGWGGFTYTRKREVARVGPVQVTAREERTIPISPIVGGVAIIAGVALVLALVGGLEHLVQAASFVFLGVFTIVNYIAWKRDHGWWTLPGAIGAGIAGLTLAAHLAGLI